MPNVKGFVTVKEIQQYLLDNVDGSNYERELNTNKEKAAFLHDVFMSEYGWAIQYYKGDKQKAVREYLMGLPSCLNIPFSYCDIKQLLESWGLINGKETELLLDNKLDQYWDRIAKQFVNLTGI